MVADRGATDRFDVFLSHNRRDAPAVEAMARRLRDAGVEVWLDAWHVAPGDRWQDRAAEGMAASDAFAVFVGAHDVGDWEKEELTVALGRAAKDADFRVFLVLLPGVPDPFEPGRLSPFLNTRAWVDLRGGWSDDASFQRLLSAIKGGGARPGGPVSHRGRAPPRRVAPGMSRRSAVWLGTLCAALAIAAGMFTLRDQVFPGQAGNAQATSVPEYEQAVGDICRDVNLAERARSADDRRLPNKLRRAQTTLAQRNALLDSVRRTIARVDHELIIFEGLRVPSSLTDRHGATAAAWNRNVSRIQGYSQRLDAAGTRAELSATIDLLARIRPALASDGDTLSAGLVYLGGGRCRLDPAIVDPTVTLPQPVHASRNRHSKTVPYNVLGPKPTSSNPPAGQSPQSGSPRQTRAPGPTTTTPVKRPSTTGAPSLRTKVQVHRLNTPSVVGRHALAEGKG